MSEQERTQIYRYVKLNIQRERPGATKSNILSTSRLGGFRMLIS